MEKVPMLSGSPLWAAHRIEGELCISTDSDEPSGWIQLKWKEINAGKHQKGNLSWGLTTDYWILPSFPPISTPAVLRDLGGKGCQTFQLKPRGVHTLPTQSVVHTSAVSALPGSWLERVEQMTAALAVAKGRMKGPLVLEACFQIERLKKEGNSYTVGGNVNWCSHYGKQYGGSSKD